MCFLGVVALLLLLLIRGLFSFIDSLQCSRAQKSGLNVVTQGWQFTFLYTVVSMKDGFIALSP